MIEHRLVDIIRGMVGIPKGVPFNAVAALEDIERICRATLINLDMARLLLTAKAFDEGMLVNCLGPLEQRYREPRETDLDDAQQLFSLGQGLQDWGVPKNETKKVVEVPKGLVSLH